MTSESAKLVKVPTLRWRAVLAVCILNFGLLMIFPNCVLPEGSRNPDFESGPARVIGRAVYSPGYLFMGVGWAIDRTKESAARREFLKRKGYPENEWNQLGLWEKINSAPATYVPSGYSAVGKYDYDKGTWFVDPSDHKRLFAPNKSWGNRDSGFWVREARSIADHLWLPPGSAPDPMHKQKS